MKHSHALGWRRWLVELVLVTCATCGVVLTMPGALPGIAAATPAAIDPVSDWNLIAMQAALTSGESAIVQSRTMAIVHVAIHDALNAIDPRYERYVFKGHAHAGASVDAAIAAAARNAVVGAIAVGALPFPQFGTPASQAVAVAQVDAAYAARLAGIPDGLPKSDGIAIGTAAAAAIVALRSTDHATTFVAYTPGTRPGGAVALRDRGARVARVRAPPDAGTIGLRAARRLRAARPRACTGRARGCVARGSRRSVRRAAGEPAAGTSPRVFLPGRFGSRFIFSALFY